MAENQSDGDFSRLLVASFQYLEPRDKLDLSQALMSSPTWDIRRKTTSLLTSKDVLATQDVAKIASLISKETDPRVAMPILRSLGKSPMVRTKPEIMEYISQSVANVLEPEIRGAALVAQTQLSLDDVTEMPPQVLQALRSQDYEYSAYGLQATGLILSKLSESENPEKSPVFLEAKQVLEILIYLEYNDIPDSVFVQAEDVYHRYFQ